MKKFSIFLLGMLGMFATSCVDDIEPAKPQVNPQEPILETGNIVSTPAGALASQSVLALEDYSGSDAAVEIMHLGETKDLPAGATVSYKLQLSNTEDFERVETLDATLGADNNYYVNAKAWNNAHLNLFGKSPKEKTVYYRVPVYVNFNGSNYRFSGVDYYAAQGTLTETCMDSGFVIEDNYYLLSDATTWDITDAANVADAKFEHNPDVSPYDDPVFVIKFQVSEDVVAEKGGCYWKIAPQSNVESGDWSTVLGTAENGDMAVKGMLVSQNAQAGLVPEAGKYKMTINMETLEYTVEKVLQPEFIYTPGASNGWNQLASAWMQVFKGTKDDVPVEYYYGVSPLKEGFKICAEPKWDNATDYGAANGDPAEKGSLINGQSGQNIVPPAEGVYWIRVNYETKGYQLTDYELTAITKVGLIGSFAASGWGSDVEMTTEDDGATYTADVTFKAGEEFKVRFNENWDYNLGGDMKALTFDGANIKVDEAGTFTVKLSLLGGVPKIELIKK